MERYKISLIENFIHSIESSYQAYQQFLEQEEILPLKETIIFLHHGIELSLKQYLLLQDPSKIFPKNKQFDNMLKQLIRRKIGMEDLKVIPYTASFSDLLKQLGKMEPAIFGKAIMYSLSELNSMRNDLIHFQLNETLEKVTSTVVYCHNWIINFNKKHIYNKDDLPKFITIDFKMILRSYFVIAKRKITIVAPFWPEGSKTEDRTSKFGAILMYGILKGLKIQFITNYTEKAETIFLNFKEMGVEVYLVKLEGFHMKFIQIDDELLFQTSANISQYFYEKNLEYGINITNEKINRENYEVIERIIHSDHVLKL